MKKLYIILLVVIVVVVAATAVYFTQEDDGPVACTMDAKICPDGSAVGRVAPNCEFAPCPDVTKDWKTYTDDESNFQLKYPQDLIPDNNEPSSFAVDCEAPNFPAVCPDSADIQKKIRDFNPSSQMLNFTPASSVDNNIKFCVASNTEGAAGTVYKTYLYLTVKDEKCIITRVVAGYPNCENYLPLEQGNVEQEGNYQNCINSNQKKPMLIELMFSTFKFIPVK